MTEQLHDDLWRDLATDAGVPEETLLSTTLAEVRRQRGRRHALRVVVAASMVAIPLAFAAIAWQFVPGPSQQLANHPNAESLPEVVEPTERETVPSETPQPNASEKKRPRGKLIVVDEPAPASPEWNVVQLTDEELLAAIPVPAKLVDTPDGKELVFQKEDQKSIPKVEPNPRRVPGGVTLLSRTRLGSRQQ